MAKDVARIGIRCVDAGEVEDRLRRLNLIGILHRGVEQRLFRFGVAEDRRGRDAQFGSDVGEGRRGKALGREDAARAVEERFAADGRRPAHL